MKNVQKIFSLQNVVLSVFKNKDLIDNSELYEHRYNRSNR